MDNGGCSSSVCPLKFLELEHKFDEAKFVILPVPYEMTTTLRIGTAQGPVRIIEMSAHLEDYDTELKSITEEVGIHTTDEARIDELEDKIVHIAKLGKIPIVLGGEHTISYIALKAFKKVYNELGVVFLDAHADLKESYQGEKFSHACTLNLILEEVKPEDVLAVGIRSISPEEVKLAEKIGLKIIFFENFESNIEPPCPKIYISIDLDVLDPAVMPSVSNPEPPGFSFQELLRTLRTLCRKAEVVGFDVVEFCPTRELVFPEITAAKLIYRLIGYISARQP